MHPYQSQFLFIFSEESELKGNQPPCQYDIHVDYSDKEKVEHGQPGNIQRLKFYTMNNTSKCCKTETKQ